MLLYGSLRGPLLAIVYIRQGGSREDGWGGGGGGGRKGVKNQTDVLGANVDGWDCGCFGVAKLLPYTRQMTMLYSHRVLVQPVLSRVCEARPTAGSCHMGPFADTLGSIMAGLFLQTRRTRLDECRVEPGLCLV